MGRPRKGPWRRGQNSHWYTTHNRKLVSVADKGTTYDEAFVKFAEILATPDPSNITVQALLQHHLDWGRANTRKPASLLGALSSSYYAAQKPIFILSRQCRAVSCFLVVV